MSTLEANESEEDLGAGQQEEQQEEEQQARSNEDLEGETSQARDDEDRDAKLTLEIALQHGLKWRNVHPRDVFALDQGGRFVISQGSVVGFEGDAIVNAANTGCLGGGGVDGAISRAGGAALQNARLALPILPGGSSKRCATGDAVITVGGDLNARYCIHAVGPMYMSHANLEEGDRMLRSAYAAAMTRAQEKNLKTIAFSLISAGIFRGEQSLERVLEVGAQAIRDASYEGLEEVHMCAFTDEELEAAIQAAEFVFAEKDVCDDEHEASEDNAADK
ncbi:O-acetyl-ADP-ribose deacetylase MACROD1 [Hondaea fermentalgiana]|uniref:O-acetyl-ADP-ribose deacetylase MACROD1 n=1 Tax=Hondaea fermentalgiana TaxID=2315210 RepID=A0A2R5GWI9_9STRA|nr:O-acetyl-ADP-ribose deacetylase MACROD1 [Hondaea fermentalgiana]|eukprot:GBG34945.1 O-acetyl-ADP-ribose deacetylase MACROD1 [Hondaea fermentalgiana]